MRKYIDKHYILTIAIIINTIILLLLSLLHSYWAFGGQLWYEDVLPTNSSGLNRLHPGMAAGLIVALGLLFLAVITIGNQGLFDKYIKDTYFRYGSLIIAVIFFLRAVGDFKFIGFFKTINRTRFAINDTQIFSPLCLFIAIVGLLIFMLNKSKL